MTLTTLVLIIGIAALIETAIFGLVFKAVKNYFISFLQNFAGSLFIFSGWVKAVDPLGTAYKMEQYFAEFEATFADTAFSFMAPLFPFLSEYAIIFSVFMIVLEIALGLMLIIGSRPKLAAWLFFLIVVFFTFLTGFTYLTAYVPGEVNFFEFSKWGEYQASNMKVTDCGCFGDFIKLEPRTSFFKDLVLLVPSILFLFFSKSMHQLSTSFVRGLLVTAATAGLIYYCMSNYVWDLPHTDFRPFKVGKNIAEAREAEDEAAANTPIFYKMTNKKSGETIKLDMDSYLARYKEFPDTEYDLEQLRGEPSIPITKISDFEVQGEADGSDITEDILGNPEPHIMIVCHKLYTEGSYQEKIMVPDTTYKYDTIYIIETQDTQIVQSIDQIGEVEKTVTKYKWKEDYLNRFKEVVSPVLEAAQKDGIDVYMVTSYTDGAIINDLREKIGANYPIHQADDILLKTIVRSNPGIVLWKNGTIVNKWHYKQLPDYEALKIKG